MTFDPALLATGNQRDSQDVHRTHGPAARRTHPDCQGQVGALASEVGQGLLGFTSQWQEAKLGEGEGHALRPPEDPLLCLPAP